MERASDAARKGPDAEARHATVLKCDVVGSTWAKKPLDLEGQLTFQRGFEQIVATLGELYDAHIEAFEGDGSLIVFGLSLAREDAAESAIRMGLALIEAVKAADIVPNVTLQLRVGIASGPIAVIKRPSDPRGEAIAGLTIHVAERLRASAAPDQVVIADATKRLAGGFFEYEDLGALSAKGFEEGLWAWRVLGESSVVSRFDAQRVASSNDEIIGRADVLARLGNLWNLAARGQGQMVWLVGDAGIGKSRLARAVRAKATAAGARTLTVDCMPSTGNTPLFPIGVLLRRTAGITPTCTEAEKRALARKLLEQLLPPETAASALTYLSPLFGLQTVSIPADIAPAEVRDHTIEAVLRMLSSLAAEGPLTVLCEDLHWADDTTATVLARVGEKIAQLPVLMILTARATSTGPPFETAISRISLEPLDRARATELVRSVARGGALSDALVERIVDRSEGVPLVLEEVTRSALEAAMRADDPALANTSGALPTPLQLVVQSRLGAWPQFTSIVQSAAVLGREFSAPLLDAMVDGTDGMVADAIKTLTREGLFAQYGEGPPDRVRFKHLMICEAVYNTLLGSDRQRLHSQAADILSRDYKGTPDAAPDLVAEHLWKARRFIEAINLRIEASADTAARGAYVESEGHCRDAITMVDEVKDPAEQRVLRFRVLVQLGVALTGRHGYSAEEVEETYRQALTVCGDSAEAEMLYPIMRGLATVNLVRGDLATAYDLSVKALKLSEQSGRTDFEIDAISVLCYTTLYHGNLSDCRSLIARCLSLYWDNDGEHMSYPVPQDAATAAIALLPTVAWLLGDPEAAETAVRDGLAHVERLNRDFDRALLHAWIAGARYTQRRYVEAIEHAQIAATISQTHGYREWYATGSLVALIAQGALTGDQQTVALAAAMFEGFVNEGVGLNASYYLLGLARAHMRAADTPSAHRMIAEAFRRAEASCETRMNAELMILQAELETDADKARSLLASALTMADEQGAVATALMASARLLHAQVSGAIADQTRETLDILEGSVPFPPDRYWMTARLSVLRRQLQEA